MRIKNAYEKSMQVSYDVFFCWELYVEFCVFRELGFFFVTQEKYEGGGWEIVVLGRRQNSISLSGLYRRD